MGVPLGKKTHKWGIVFSGAFLVQGWALSKGLINVTIIPHVHI